MIFGRSSECERIDGLLARARSGRSGTLLILGEAGVGKTALLEAARERAEAMRVISACGVPSEEDIPFGGLLELLRPLLGALESLPERQAEALRSALGIDAPVPGDRFLIGAATLSMIAIAAESQPILVIADDAHWLDGESLDALLFAARRFEADAVATLIAGRTDELRLETVAGLETIDLRCLDATGTAQLAESRLGRRLNEQDGARIFGLTRGNPLAVIEIGTSDEALAFDAPATLSPSVEDAYSRRLRDLEPDLRSMLLVAAIDDSLGVAGVECAAAAAGVTATLADAEDSGLIVLREGRVIFRHPLVRSAVYQTASAAQRRAAHAAVAHTLAGDERAGRRAWHEAAACLVPDERIAAALAHAADEARERGGYGAAAGALERAARLTPDSRTRAQRLYLAAVSAFRAGLADQAGRLVGAALSACDEPLLRADIEVLQALLLDASGASTEASELLLREGRRVAASDPERAAVMLARASVVCLHGGAIRDALPIGLEALELAENVGGDFDESVGSTLGQVLIFAGRLSEAEPLLRRSSTSMSMRTQRELVPLIQTAVNLAYLCDYPSSRDIVTEAVDLARSQGAVGVLPNAGEVLAHLQVVLGSWDAAIATATESLRLAYDTHQSKYGVGLCTALAGVAAARGRREECLARVAEADEFAGGRASWAGHGVAGTALGHLALAQGEIDEAISHLEREVDLDAAQASVYLYLAAFDLAEAYVRANRPADATSLIERVTPHAHQVWARAALDRCRGLAAADDGFDEPSRAAVGAFARLQAPFQEARSRLCRGERLRRARRNVEARDELRAAFATFERLSAEPWAARAHRELAAAGVTLGRGTPSALAELTPQELQVARIVSTGATNREAAAQLFLSPKTIEAHLHRAYRKLGLNGRAQLRNALVEDRQDQSRG